MKNLDALNDWLNQVGPGLEATGFTLQYVNHGQGQSSLQIDNADVVGTITYWPPDLFEFQFNRTGDGQVIAIETVRLGGVGDITKRLELLGILKADRNDSRTTIPT
jgi:hypothetical protein